MFRNRERGVFTIAIRCGMPAIEVILPNSTPTGWGVMPLAFSRFAAGLPI